MARPAGARCLRLSRTHGGRRRHARGSAGRVAGAAVPLSKTSTGWHPIQPFLRMHRQAADPAAQRPVPHVKRMRTLTALTLLGMLSLAACAGAADPIQPVRDVDLSRYMGRWYVIASIPTRFERGGHNPVETYSRNADGTICTWFRQRRGSFDA